MSKDSLVKNRWNEFKQRGACDKENQELCEMVFFAGATFVMGQVREAFSLPKKKGMKILESIDREIVEYVGKLVLHTPDLRKQ